MPRISDQVALRHPESGGTHTTSARSAESLKRRGWIEAKSSEAPAAVEAIPSPDGEPLTPSQEEDK